jgi:hypothetical protein
MLASGEHRGDTYAEEGCLKETKVRIHCEEDRNAEGFTEKQRFLPRNQKEGCAKAGNQEKDKREIVKAPDSFV